MRHTFILLATAVFFTIFLYMVHFAAVEFFFSKTSFFYTLFDIYLFHLGAVLMVLFFVKRAVKKKKNVFNAFVYVSIGKVIATIVFFIPLFLEKKEGYQFDVLAFFTPYFLFLFFEIYMLSRLLGETKKTF